MKSSRFNLKKLIFACLIPVFVLVIHNIVYLAVYWGSAVFGGSPEDANIAYMASFFSYGLCIVIFGSMYYFLSCDKTNRKEETDAFPPSPQQTTVTSRGSRRILSCILLILLGFVLQFVVTYILNVIYYFHPDWLASYQDMMQSSFSIENGAVRVLTVMLLAPVAEELAFRGVMLSTSMQAFSCKHSALCSVLLVSVGFGLYHGNLVQFIYATLIGLILGTLAVHSKGLLYPIVLHASINISAYVLPIMLSGLS